MIVATAGHIDHGKTLLVKALTGVDTDRLPEEKARGISIDLGFAYLPLAQGGLIGFVDVPGHERFLRNMLAGVCGIDSALLVIAADDGVMPQTVEHLQVLDLLGIEHGIAVITKIDRVAPEQLAKVQAQVRALLAETRLAGIPVIPVSAVTGTGIESLRDALASAARGFCARNREGQHFRLAIDRAFTVVGSGTVVTGTVFNGEIKPGDRLVVSPLGAPVRVRGIQIRGMPKKQAHAGERCAINLSGIEVATVGRGDWLMHGALHAPSRRLEVHVKLLAKEQTSLGHWTPVHVHLGTADIMARVATIGAASIAPGASARVQLVLDKPMAALHDDRFILRDQSANRTLGGGRVLDPFAPATRRTAPARLATIEALGKGTASDALEELLKIHGQPIDVARFERTFNLTAERAARLYQSADAELFGREQRIAIARAGAEALRQEVLARLAEFHRTQPQALGMKLEALRTALAPCVAAEAFSELLQVPVAAGKLEIRGSSALLPGHDATANSADEKIWGVVLPALLQGGCAPPQTAQLAAVTGIMEPVLKDFLHRKSKTGEVMRVSEHRFYPRSTLQMLAETAAELARSSPQGTFTAAQYRDANGANRALSIQILELFDTLGITQRVGEGRRMRKEFLPLPGSDEHEKRC